MVKFLVVYLLWRKKLNLLQPTLNSETLTTFSVVCHSMVPNRYRVERSCCRNKKLNRHKIAQQIFQPGKRCLIKHWKFNESSNRHTQVQFTYSLLLITGRWGTWIELRFNDYDDEVLELNQPQKIQFL